MARMGVSAVVAVFAVLVVVGVVGAQDCSTAINSLVPCLTYVSGPDAAPSASCCSGLTSLNTNSPACLCQLITQINSTSTASVNVTKAYALPSDCKLTLNTKTCPALANLPGATPTASPSTPAAAGPVAAAAGPGSSHGVPPTASAAPSSFAPSSWIMAMAALAVLFHF